MKVKTNLLTTFAMLCVIAGFSQSFSFEGLDYEVISTNPNEVSLTGGTPLTTDLLIPETVTDASITYTVVAIANGVFESAELTSVSFPSTIRTIGNQAFLNNQLTALTIPPNVVSIGFRAFQGNQIAGSLIIPNSVIGLGFAVFEANDISSITIPENLTAIPNDIFRENNLTSVTIPAGITSIGNNSFRGNPLTEVIAEATTPPSIANGSTDSFLGSRSNIDLTVPPGTEAEYEATGWIGFNSVNGVVDFEVGDTFTENNISYIITSLSPNEVTVTGGATVPQNLIIPENVSSAASDFVVTAIGDSAFIDSSLTSVTFPSTLRELGVAAFKNNLITELSLPESLTTIETEVFRVNQISTVIIPQNVTSIAAFAFSGGNPVVTVICEGIVPPSVALSPTTSAFSNPQNIDLTVPDGTELAYEAEGWIGFNTVNGVANFEVGDTFSENNFDYQVISLNPNEVTINGGTNVPQNLIISENVSSGASDFVVTAIGDNAFRGNDLTTLSISNSVTLIDRSAFRDNQLTSVTIPNSVITISNDAFRNNQLTSVIIPNSVTTLKIFAFGDNQLTSITLGNSVSTIERDVFDNNPLATVTVLATAPPTTESIDGIDSFGNRSGVNLFVPEDSLTAYINSGHWDGFNSITGITIDITLAPKVFLQGAGTNPNSGEEDLMRDSLRENGLLPTTSPYGDGATVDPTVFNTTGADAIVDWVLVEVRDANDNTSIVADQSALLQRDGDVVAIDGVSPLSINAPTTNYFVVIKHRNHLGVMTANTVALSATVTSLDFTDANTPITFGTNAQTIAGMPTNTFGMWAGNVNGDGVVQFSGANPDAPFILSNVLNDAGNFLNLPTFAINGYNNSDVNMDGSTQFAGASPDTPLILQNVLAHPGNFLNFSTFAIIEQLPENSNNTRLLKRYQNKFKR